LGHKNFTEAFAKTDEFKRLIDLGHVTIRYPRGNPYGVRYEPWHVGVV
jgi:LAS superfamily LD-carboxypeptidase LdcB